jgi:prepilin-type N-terminal cleavage/methylation domain-containing protein
MRVSSLINRQTKTRGYTLVEILIVVIILGIASSLIIPSMGSAQVLRVQASMRAVVADITFAQSDALAYQERRAVYFDIPNNRYAVIQVTGAVLDPVNDILFDTTRHSGRMEVDLNEPRFGGATIVSADFDGDSALIFDELGGPVQTPTGDAPGLGGTIRIEGADGTAWEITVEAYTGRVSVLNVTP